MIVLLFAMAGAALGAVTARRHGGDRLDLAQYVAVYAIIFAVIGVAISIVLVRIAN